MMQILHASSILRESASAVKKIERFPLGGYRGQKEIEKGMITRFFWKIPGFDP
ncbi:MAG TPA: hypothetical protein H9691_07210 [Firmicutes bacterium]|nr:hypothetical protein [Bacillota bacterium]